MNWFDIFWMAFTALLITGLFVAACIEMWEEKHK